MAGSSEFRWYHYRPTPSEVAKGPGILERVLDLETLVLEFDLILCCLQRRANCLDNNIIRFMERARYHNALPVVLSQIERVSWAQLCTMRACSLQFYHTLLDEFRGCHPSQGLESDFLGWAEMRQSLLGETSRNSWALCFQEAIESKYGITQECLDHVVQLGDLNCWGDRNLQDCEVGNVGELDRLSLLHTVQDHVAESPLLTTLKSVVQSPRRTASQGPGAVPLWNRDEDKDQMHTKSSPNIQMARQIVSKVTHEVLNESPTPLDDFFDKAELPERCSSSTGVVSRAEASKAEITGAEFMSFCEGKISPIQNEVAEDIEVQEDITVLEDIAEDNENECFGSDDMYRRKDSWENLELDDLLDEAEIWAVQQAAR